MEQKIDLPVTIAYDGDMKKIPPIDRKYRGFQLPVFIEKGEDGFYVIECPLLQGCHTQGKTIDEALQNIREVILLILEEQDAQKIMASYHPRRASLHTVTL